MLKIRELFQIIITLFIYVCITLQINMLMMKISIPTILDIETTYSRIKPFVHNTPVLKSELINSMLDCELFFKCENFQKAGTFKYRGATNAVLCLTNAAKLRGVATHSSGNHAGALAKASAINGVKAYIVMPKTAPKVKIDAVNSYGGEITFCEPTLQARESNLEKVIEGTGAVMIHPYDNFDVISGQGTACLELTKQITQPDIVMAPVGGGGLLGGTSLVSKSLWKSTKVIAGEPANADDAYQSFKSGKHILSQNPNTIADGLLTSLSDRTYTIMVENVDDVLIAKEETIVEAMKLVYQYLKIVIEPSSAVPLAAVMENIDIFKGKKVAIILSGGNVDLGSLLFYLS